MSLTLSYRTNTTDTLPDGQSKSCRVPTKTQGTQTYRVVDLIKSKRERGRDVKETPRSEISTWKGHLDRLASRMPVVHDYEQRRRAQFWTAGQQSVGLFIWWGTEERNRPKVGRALRNRGLEVSLSCAQWVFSISQNRFQTIFLCRLWRASWRLEKIMGPACRRSHLFEQGLLYHFSPWQASVWERDGWDLPPWRQTVWLWCGGRRKWRVLILSKEKNK